MTRLQSLRKILAFLNAQKIDLLVLYDQIKQSFTMIPEDFLTNKIQSHFSREFQNIENVLVSCENIIEFWNMIHYLSGGLRFQNFQEKIQTKDGTLRVNLQAVGFSILRSHKSKSFGSYQSLQSLSWEQWRDILSLLQSDSSIKMSARRSRDIAKHKYETEVTQHLKAILKENPELSDEDKQEFSTLYRRTRVSLEEFLQSKYNTLHKSLPISTRLPKSVDDDSENNFDGYATYLEADEREIARMKRTGEYSVGKRGKKRKRSNAS
ncbi:MAG: hypothetical protein JW776_03340 [Candidatus Lokiarchaeota archaeon]|nr:hypothetical protein [Candidatus Lokiarchaeota archaeon]